MAEEVASKWANVPHEELQKYVDQSPQRPGESDTDWAARNVLYELQLQAKYPPPSEDVPAADAVLSGEGTVSGPDENPG